MKVYKFGGASVKDAEAVRNVGRIIEKYGEVEVWVVVSAMGKTTNALETILDAYRFNFNNKEKLVESLWGYHENIMHELFPFGEDIVWNEAEEIFSELKIALENAEGRDDRTDYAEVISKGEMLSSRIVSAYLQSIGILNEWVDARDLIHTDNRPEDASVEMEKSKRSFQAKREELLTSGGLHKEGELVVLTQGFIGSHNGKVTTLGREGSDFTGGIIAWSLNAKELTIWKDVPGMLNADPKYFTDAEVLREMSYREAIELSYYGASVIHPKTIKPLQNRSIPLFVRSFIHPELEGTRIHENDKHDDERASYIFKQDQVLISISPVDFSFIMEENMSEIFRLLAKHALRANLVQNSALSLSICMDDKGKKVDSFREELSDQFRVRYNQGLSLITIRHYNEPTIDKLLRDRVILVEQRSRQTARYVVRGGFTQSS
ncbi:MAG: aspartate kinase [Flavobacteriales bacterium]|nr:aspartate kinase [Flavobacteriales bacterium]